MTERVGDRLIAHPTNEHTIQADLSNQAAWRNTERA